MHFNKRSRKKVHRTYPHPVYTMPYKYQLSAAILYVLRKNRELLYFPIIFRTFFHNFLGYGWSSEFSPKNDYFKYKVWQFEGSLHSYLNEGSLYKNKGSFGNNAACVYCMTLKIYFLHFLYHQSSFISIFLVKNKIVELFNISPFFILNIRMQNMH